MGHLPKKVVFEFTSSVVFPPFYLLSGFEPFRPYPCGEDLLLIFLNTFPLALTFSLSFFLLLDMSQRSSPFLCWVFLALISAFAYSEKVFFFFLVFFPSVVDSFLFAVSGNFLPSFLIETFVMWAHRASPNMDFFWTPLPPPKVLRVYLMYLLLSGLGVAPMEPLLGFLGWMLASLHWNKTLPPFKVLPFPGKVWYLSLPFFFKISFLQAFFFFLFHYLILFPPEVEQMIVSSSLPSYFT